METHSQHDVVDRRPFMKSKSPAVKWIKEWVPQEIATGGKCMLLKWVTEDTLKALKEKEKEAAAPAPESGPEHERTTEVLFLCCYEGCGKTFIDAGTLRKHALIHGERQYVCHYEGCGKKFLDSSKLKRHFLIHTGERDFVCPHEGCGKAFSLDFNLRVHVKTHSQENYHLCPYPDCGKRYAYENKLKNHIGCHHEKKASVDRKKHRTPSPENQTKGTQPSGGTHCSASFVRPYACPYEGCAKAYVHEYKLKLHLKKGHPGHMSDEIAESTQANAEQEMDEAIGQDAYGGKQVKGKSEKQSKPKPDLKLPPSKSQHKGSNPFPSCLNLNEEPMEDETYEEEDGDDVEDGWRYTGNSEDDDEEIE